MATDLETVQATGNRWKLSLDWWAVITALILAVLVLVGVLPNIPW